jgi:hypothetical protein
MARANLLQAILLQGIQGTLPQILARAALVRADLVQETVRRTLAHRILVQATLARETPVRAIPGAKGVLPVVQVRARAALVRPALVRQKTLAEIHVNTLTTRATVGARPRPATGLRDARTAVSSFPFRATPICGDYRQIVLEGSHGRCNRNRSHLPQVGKNRYSALPLGARNTNAVRSKARLRLICRWRFAKCVLAF